MTNEPMNLPTVLTSAVTLTLAALSLIFDWSAELTGAITLAVGAWIPVLNLVLLRQWVTPVAVVNEVMSNRGTQPISTTEFADARK